VWQLKFLFSVVFIGIALLLSDLLNVKPRPVGSMSMYYEISQYGKARHTKYDKGIGIFKPLRVFLSRYIDPSSFFNERINGFKRAGVYGKINPIDVSLSKVVLIIPMWIYLGFLLLNSYSLYGSFRTAVRANVFILLGSMIFTLAIYFSERLILMLLENERSYKVIDEYLEFVPFFSSCIGAGDNVYNAFRNCSILEGSMGEQALLTAQRIRNSGDLEESLDGFAEHFATPEILAFTQIVKNGEEGNSDNFSDFLKESLNDYNERLVEMELTKHEKKPLVFSVANAMILGAIMINVLIFLLIFAMNALNMIG